VPSKASARAVTVHIVTLAEYEVACSRHLCRIVAEGTCALRCWSSRATAVTAMYASNSVAC
jgi:hypothetical protein